MNTHQKMIVVKGSRVSKGSFERKVRGSIRKAKIAEIRKLREDVNKTVIATHTPICRGKASTSALNALLEQDAPYIFLEACVSHSL